jgi:CelD/BcsL family acetyltransferase involved in cellulose biosynthesis
MDQRILDFRMISPRSGANDLNDHALINTASASAFTGLHRAMSTDAFAASFAVAPWTDCAAEDCAQWDALARRAASPNPFFESWSLRPALAHFDPHGRVKLGQLRRPDGTLSALIPIERRPRYGRYPIPHLASWLHANCFLGAPLVANGGETAFWRGLLEWADHHAGSALFLHLAAMPLDEPLTDALIALCEAQGRQIALVHREERAMLASQLSPADYLANAVPGKKRKEYRRQHARLSEQGTLAFVRQSDDADLSGWIDHFLALEAQGWKGRAGSALACADRTAGLFRQSLIGAAQRGQLERLSLTLDGQPIAMLVNFLAAPGAFSFKTAFDERFARFSPGVLLQLENLALLERGEIHWCDSCAAADHPMIDSLWTERRRIGRFSVAIGGKLRRAAFGRLVQLELARTPTGIS